MTDTSVDAPGPPKQETELIASWGDGEYAIRLESHGDGHAAVSMWVEGDRQTVAHVDYGATGATSDVRWNDTGTIALEQYKRDMWDTRFYARLAEWLKSRAAS